MMKATLCAVNYKEFERTSPWPLPKEIPRILMDYETQIIWHIRGI